MVENWGHIIIMRHVSSIIIDMVRSEVRSTSPLAHIMITATSYKTIVYPKSRYWTAKGIELILNTPHDAPPNDQLTLTAHNPTRSWTWSLKVLTCAHAQVVQYYVGKGRQKHALYMALHVLVNYGCRRVLLQVLL